MVTIKEVSEKSHRQERLTKTCAVFAQVQVASDFTRRFPSVDETNAEFYDKNVKSFLTSILELTAFVRPFCPLKSHTYPAIARSERWPLDPWPTNLVESTASQDGALSSSSVPPCKRRPQRPWILSGLVERLLV
jgi:hypothetical protein